MKNKQKLNGSSMDSAAVMAMLEILNGGPEIGRLSPEDRIKIAMPKVRHIGRVFVASTAEDMSKSGREMWDLWNKNEL